MFCISVLFGNLPFRTLCLYLMVCPRHKDLNKHLIYTCVIIDHTRVPSVYRAIGLPWGAVFSSGFQNIPLAWIAASFHWPTGGLSLPNKKSWFVWCWALKKSFGESVIYFKPYCMPLATLDLTGLFSLELIQSSHCSVSDQLCEWPGSLQLSEQRKKIQSGLSWSIPGYKGGWRVLVCTWTAAMQSCIPVAEMTWTLWSREVGLMEILSQLGVGWLKPNACKKLCCGWDCLVSSCCFWLSLPVVGQEKWCACLYLLIKSNDWIPRCWPRCLTVFAVRPELGHRGLVIK